MPKIFRCDASALIIRQLPGGEDTGRRVIHDQTVVAHGRSYDDRWLYVVAPAGSGWVSAVHLVEQPAGTPLRATWPVVPHGLAAIIKLFGEPCTDEVQRGRARLPAALPLSYDPQTRVTSFVCHPLLADIFTSVFREIHARGLWELLEDFGGCFNCRKKRGTLTKKSTHCWAIACDVAVQSNPLGATPKLDGRIVAIFEDHGFTWGGRWGRPDGMHFQYATGY